MSSTDAFDTGLTPDELDPERPRPFDTPWGSFAVYVVDGRLLAAQSFCPHLLGPLFQGTRRGTEVICPWHGWRYSLVTGRCTHRPEGLARFAPRIALCAVEIGPCGTILLRPDEG